MREIKIALSLLCLCGLAAPARAESPAQVPDQLPTQVPDYAPNYAPVCSPAYVKHADPTRGGKYKQLLHTLAMPLDCRQYGPILDWGYWPGTEYGEYKRLKPGFWVYVYPNWYVYGIDTSAPKCPQPADAQRQASLDGKYARPLMKLSAPQDQRTYGCFNDYGYSPATSYLDQPEIPAGYWVYLYPYWYVWSEAQIAAPPPTSKD